MHSPADNSAQKHTELPAIQQLNRDRRYDRTSSFAAKVAAFTPLSSPRIHRFVTIGGWFVRSQIVKFGFNADNSRAILRARAQCATSAGNETFNASSPRSI